MTVIGAVMLTLGLLGVAVQLSQRATRVGHDLAPSMSIGDCITESQMASRKIPPDPVDCSRKYAIYKLAYHDTGPTATCPDGKRDNSKYLMLYNDAEIYCFTFDTAVGECFSMDPDVRRFTQVDCTDPTANAQIDRILDGTTDVSACPSGPTGVTFPEPKQTFCTVEPHR